MCIRDRNILTTAGCNENLLDNLTVNKDFSCCVPSVSYTHLDVYKRQPLKLLIEKEKKPKAIEKKINDSQDIEMDDIEQRMKNKRSHEDSVLHLSLIHI